MTTEPFIKTLPDGGYLVGARDAERDYDGPAARVHADDTWLNIVTDDYEGHAMLNIETLPMLRRALARIAKERKA